MNEENKYVVMYTAKCDCNNLLKGIYWVVKLKDARDGVLKDKGLSFSYESEASRVCEWLNNELERNVDEKLYKMFHCGEIEVPFDFLDAWNNKCEERIVKRFDKFKNRDAGFMVKCHFDSDLLILSNVPYGMNGMEFCRLLEIPYDSYFGASTFLSNDLILNVSKVREMMER